MARAVHHRMAKHPALSEPVDNAGPVDVDQPVFVQPAPTPDPTKFVVRHPSDDPAYMKIDELNRDHKVAPIPFPAPRGLPEPKRPQALQVPAHSDKVTLQNYDDQDYGYLRVVVTLSQLRIEYHPASDGDAAKTPDDFVTVDLATRKLVHFTG